MLEIGPAPGRRPPGARSPVSVARRCAAASSGKVVADLTAAPHRGSLTLFRWYVRLGSYRRPACPALPGRLPTVSAPRFPSSRGVIIVRQPLLNEPFDRYPEGSALRPHIRQRSGRSWRPPVLPDQLVLGPVALVAHSELLGRWRSPGPAPARIGRIGPAVPAQTAAASRESRSYPRHDATSPTASTPSDGFIANPRAGSMSSELPASKVNHPGHMVVPRPRIPRRGPAGSDPGSACRRLCSASCPHSPRAHVAKECQC